jgi:hypothetical protein
LIQNGNLVAFLQLAALVSADDCVIDKGSVSREILEDGHGVSVLLLREKNAVAVRNGGGFENTI